jgi:sugar lactone lactonase YvrE
MRRSAVLAFVVLGVLLAFAAPPVAADEGGVVRFATLPKPGPGFPEGLAADARGNIYVATFDFSTSNVIHIFNGSSGHLRDTIPLPPGTVPLGLGFDGGGNLYAADFENGNVLKFSPPFGAASTPAATYPVCGGRAAGCGLNALTFDAAGNLYVSDSFGGNIFKITLPGGGVSVFFFDDLLKPVADHGFPPFGANGIAFDAGETALYIANTADDRILKLTLAGMTLSKFAESINGADGIAFDASGRLWVAANQADEVVALNSNGRVVERRGSFDGIGHDGAPRGLLFPASIVISRGSIYVTNLALALTPAVGDEPEEGVSTYTVSRIPLPGHGH